VEIPQGTFDPVLGASYVQISREGLGFQKSQNGGPNVPKAGPVSSGYHRFASTIAVPDKEKDFFEGIDTSLVGLATLAQGALSAAFVVSGLTRINAAVEAAMAKFSAAAPEQSAPALAAGMKETLALIATVSHSGLSADSKYDLLHELNIKRAQFNNALAEALSLSITATVAPDQEPNARMAEFLGDPETFRAAIPGQTFGVRVHAVNQSGAPATLQKVSVENTDGPAWLVIAAVTPPAVMQPPDLKFTVTVPPNATLTRPYFTRPYIEQSYYNLNDERYLNQSLSPYPLAAWTEWMYAGVPIRIGQYVQTVKRVTGSGTMLEPLVVAPAIGIQISPRHGVVSLDAKAFDVKAVVHSNVKGPATGTVRLDVPAGWKSQPASAAFATTQDGEDRTLAFTVTPADLRERSYAIHAVAVYGGREYREGYQVAGYTNLRPYFLYAPATCQTTGVNVKVAPGLKIGYVMGSGDEVPGSLEHLGIKVDFLTAADLANGDLARFDAILLGVRTYAARPELPASNHRLLEYVNNGGVVIVQYNTPEFDHNYGPYPYTMGGNPEEVTDEASKVQILAPANPLFRWPNQITEKDFAGWVEERGSKWMRQWDPRYEALLETHDEGQEPQKGGLLYAKYGKGFYVYNAYAFYRQLPEGVPGAYRIFANLVSLAKNPGR
jgi:hypothetical protein